jgi:hypothetical protein
MDPIRAAEKALVPVLGRVRLTAGERLRSSGRSEVLRAVTDDGHRVVVKAPLVSDDGPAREAAALRLLTAHGVPGVVRLLAAGIDPPVLVLTDAGTGPTLADSLLGADPAAARVAMLAWAGTLGALQAATIGLRGAYEAELAALSPLGPLPVDESAGMLADAVGRLERTLPELGMRPTGAALDELRGLAADLDVSGPGAPGALTPGDICPDNAVAVGAGFELLDLEHAEYRHVAWEAAYLTVPWPSCWCAWALPAPVVGAALQRWRSALAPALPYVATAAFDADLDRATIGWVIVTAAWFLPLALAGDVSMEDPDRPPQGPTRQQAVQHRLALAATLGPPTPLRALAAEMHEATVRAWGTQALPLAPAFR